MTINDEVLALDERRLKAMVAGNVGELEKLLHRDLKYIHSSGLVDSKDSYICGVQEKLWDCQSTNTSNEVVSVYGETALIHCRLQIDLKVKDVQKQVSRADCLDPGRRALAGRCRAFDGLSAG